MRALSYCRVSTERQADQTSLEDQARANEEKLRTLGATDIVVVNEKDTGTKWEEREKLGGVLTEIEAGHYQIICIYNVDRAVRTWEFIAKLNLSCKKGNARLVFATRDYDQSTFGELMMVVDSFRAQWGREDLIKNMVRGKRGRMLAGNLPRWGPEKFGYRRDKEAGVALIYEPEAAILRRAGALALNGLSMHRIIIQLNKEGDRTRLGNLWTVNALRRLFNDPAYKGEPVYWRRRHGKTASVTHPESEWIKLPAGLYPPIFTSEQWAEINERIHHGSAARARNERRFVLLREMVFCARCAAAMWASGYALASGRHYEYFRCSTRKSGEAHGQRGACEAAGISVGEITGRVWARVAEAISQPPLVAALAELPIADPTAALDAEASALRAEVAHKNAEVERLVRSLRRANELVALHIERELNALEAERRDLLRRLDSVAARRAAHARAADHQREVADFCRGIADHLRAGSLLAAEQRALFEVIKLRVFVDGKKDCRIESLLVDVVV